MRERAFELSTLFQSTHRRPQCGLHGFRVAVVHTVLRKSMAYSTTKVQQIALLQFPQSSVAIRASEDRRSSAQAFVTFFAHLLSFRRLDSRLHGRDRLLPGLTDQFQDLRSNSDGRQNEIRFHGAKRTARHSREYGVVRILNDRGSAFAFDNVDPGGSILEIAP